MIWGLIVIVVLAVIFFFIALFLGKEMLRKFRRHDQFVASEGFLKKLVFYWKGNKEKGMRNICLEANSPFKVLVGFKLVIPFLNFEGTDWYEGGESIIKSGRHYAIISTFMWKKPKEFRFLINSPDPNIKISIVLSQSATAKLEPNIVSSPHLYQKLGFYS